jgi:hypothetical protein
MDELSDGVNANLPAYIDLVVDELRGHFPNSIDRRDLRSILEMAVPNVLPAWQADFGKNVNDEFARAEAKELFPSVLAWLIEDGTLVADGASSYKISRKVFDANSNVKKHHATATENSHGDATNVTDSIPVDATAPAHLPVKNYLLTWGEIHEVLGRTPNDRSSRRQITELNERFEGPIQSQGTGRQPIVDRRELIEWWDRLLIGFEDKRHQEAGAPQKEEDGFNFGRKGTAMPSVAGGVKLRREGTNNLTKVPKRRKTSKS